MSKISGFYINDGVNLPVFGNTAVTRLFYDKGSFTIDYMNDSSHLDGMEVPQWGKAAMLRTESFDPASDKDYYCACYEDAWLSAHGSLECFTPGPYYRSAIEHYALNSRAVQRVFDGDKSAGLIDLDTQRGAHAGYGWISLIYLKEEYRRRGCGIQLLARAMVLYRALGRKSLRLHVAEDNTDALAFYRRWGFEEISREGNSLGSLILMEKPIGGSRNEN
ncbi:MAG: GNAT family N-acetyltransferase [Oscillospiraceae bacterium]|nr:GNAT family N-acetyltransferase [Oscillospiraceae bacterium]